MATQAPPPQRIARLAPLADVLAWIDANVHPVAPREADSSDAVGHVLADDIKVPRALPPRAIALRDGYALQSDATSDASSYAPAPLAAMPVRVDLGEPLPTGTDCVASLDHIAIKGDRAEALAVVAPGEGVLPAGGDAAANAPFLRTGKSLRAHDVAILRAAGIAKVSVRAPRIMAVQAGPANDAIVASATTMIATFVASGGGMADGKSDLQSALQANDADAIIAIGGTGAGRNDNAVTTLSAAGKVAFHGVGLNPGETTAIGIANGKPVLLLPGRIDAAFAAWLVLGRRMLARLAGGGANDVTTPLKLSRKVTSTIGIADVVLLKRQGDNAEPLTSGAWPMQALAQADFFLVVPPESEGFPAGATVHASPLP
jgi:molybdopterin biosynthesis enzyme